MHNKLFWLGLLVGVVFGASRVTDKPSWSAPSLVSTPPENNAPPPPPSTVDQIGTAPHPTLHQKIKERYRLGQCELNSTPFFMERRMAHLKERLALAGSEEPASIHLGESEMVKPMRVSFRTGTQEIRYFRVNDAARHEAVAPAFGPIADGNPTSILKRRLEVELDERPAKRAKVEDPSYEDGSYTSDSNWIVLSSGPAVNENRVVIYPLSEGTTADEVYQYYQKFGPIKRISVVEDENRRRATVGFIDFTDRKIAEQAILDGMKRRCPAHKILSDALTIDLCPSSFTFAHRILMVVNVKPETWTKFNVIAKYSFWTVRRSFERSDPENGWRWTQRLEISRVSRICRSQGQPNQVQLTFHSRQHLEAASKKLEETGFHTYYIKQI